MKLNRLSENFTPLKQGLFFGIKTEIDTPSDVVVEIVESHSDTVVATQQLRSVTDAEVNIAPYVARFGERMPLSHPHSSFCDAPTAMYHIRVGEAVSESVIYSVNGESVLSPTIVSAMPSARTIAFGESDEIMLSVKAGDELIAEITTDTGESLSVEYTTETGIAILYLATGDFEADVRKIDIDIYRNGSLLSSLHYKVIPAYKGVMRLAWLSDLGSIERYTFPVIAKVERKSEKRVISTLENSRVVASETELLVSLYSRYEPQKTVEALAQIASSTKVWVEQNGEFSEVKVLTSTLKYNLFDEPSCVEITLSMWRREEVAL